MKWTISEHNDEERFGSGLYDTKEQAIAQGRLDYHGRPFYIGEAFPQEASRFLPTASDIIEQMASNAYDEIGEPASEWPDLPKSSAAEIELDILLTQWLVKHAAALKCEFWSVENIERIEP